MKIRTKHNYLMGMLFVLMMTLLSTIVFAVTQYNVILQNGNSNNGNVIFDGNGKATRGVDYTCTITPNDGYKLVANNIAVSIGGAGLERADDKWSYNAATHQLTIGADYVNGYIEIYAEAEEIIAPVQVFATGFNTAETKTYGNAKYTRTTSLTTGGGAITYSSDDTNVATVNSSTGEVTIVGAGEARIIATAAEVEDTWAETSVSYTLTVSPKTLIDTDLEYKSGSKTKIYDGNTTSTTIVVGVKDASLVESTDVVTVTGTQCYNGFDVDSVDKIFFTTSAITEGNYALAGNIIIEITGASITKRPVTVNVTPATKNFGETNPTFIGTVDEDTPMVNGEVYANLGVTYETTATQTSNIGKYNVTKAGATNTNYDVTVKGTNALTIVAVAPTYNMATTANIKVGSELSDIDEPENGIGVGGESIVTGITTWYSDSGRTTLAVDGDLSDLATDATKTLYWKFVPSDTNYATVTGETLFTIAGEFRVDILSYFYVPRGNVGTSIDPINIANGVTGGVPPYTYALAENPTWLTISASGVLSGTRPEEATGATTTKIRVSDSSRTANDNQN